MRNGAPSYFSCLAATWRQHRVNTCQHIRQKLPAARLSNCYLVCIFPQCELYEYGPPEVFAHDMAPQTHSIDGGFLSEECCKIIQVGIVWKRCHIQAALICLPCCLIKRGWCLPASGLAQDLVSQIYRLFTPLLEIQTVYTTHCCPFDSFAVGTHNKLLTAVSQDLSHLQGTTFESF